MVRVAHKYMPDEISEAELKGTFAAREHTLDYLVKVMRSQVDKQTLTSYLLTGPRGSGKTTLMRLLQLAIREDEKLSAAWLPVRFPEELPNVASLRDLLAAALEVLAEQGIPEARSWHERAEAEMDDEASQDLAIGGLRRIARDQGKRLVLMIENLDMLFERGLTNGTRATLRRLLMTDPFMMIVGSAVQVFPAVKAYDEAFFNYFCPVPLKRLNNKQACAILRRRAEWEGNDQFESLYRKHQSKIRTISLLTGGNPRLLLMLYEILTLREVGSAVQTLRVLVDELTPLLKDIIEHQLAPQQVTILDALMRLDGKATPSQIAQKGRLPLNAVTVQLKRLTDADILELQGGGKGRTAWYTVRDRLFYTWYQMRYLRPQRRRIEMFVQVLDIWYEAEERLKTIEALSASLPDCPNHHVRSRAETIEYFAASLERTPHFPRARTMAILGWVRAGDFTEALSVFQEWNTEEGPSDQHGIPSSHWDLSQWLADQGDDAHAVDVLAAGLDDTRTLLQCAWALMQAGEYGEALKCLDRIVASEPSDTRVLTFALFNRGHARQLQRDLYGAISDYTRVIGLPDTPVGILARALANRGSARGVQKDLDGAMEDYTAAIELPNAPAEVVAAALINRASQRRTHQDVQGAIEDYTNAIGLPNAPVDMVARAFVDRAIAKNMKKDLQGAIADYTTTIELREAPTEQVATALVNRAVVKVRQQDLCGAMADSTAILQMPDAPIEMVAQALVNRSFVRQAQGDLEGTIADCSAVIELPNVPNDLIAQALVNRSRAKYVRGDLRGTIADCDTVVAAPDVPPEQLGKALTIRGSARRDLGRDKDALRDWTEVLTTRGISVELGTLAAQMALQNAAAHCDRETRNLVISELIKWLLHLPREEQPKRTVDILMSLAKPGEEEVWIAAYSRFTASRAEEMAAEMRMFRPVAEVLASGDRTKLDPLPPEQRDFALDVLKRFEGPETTDEPSS